MKVYGWTEAQIRQAAADMSAKVENEFILRDLVCLSENSRRGGSTFQFILRPKNGARRTGSRKQPIPFKDLFGADCPDSVYPPCVKITRRWRGSDRHGIASPCWHGFGHFFRALFNLNPNGKIVAGGGDYDGEADLDRIVGSTRMVIGGMSCDCRLNGLEEF